MKANSTKQPRNRSARKKRAESNMNQAAEGVIGLSPLVGVRSEDIGDAVRATLRNAASR